MEVEFVVGEVPPSAVEHALQSDTGGNDQNAGQNAGAQNKEQGAVGQFREEHRGEYRSNAVNGADRKVEKAWVDKGMFFDGTECHADTPA